jgi:hypothetical protein
MGSDYKEITAAIIPPGTNVIRLILSFIFFASLSGSQGQALSTLSNI